MTTLTRGQYAPLLHRSCAAPHSTLPQQRDLVFLRRDLRLRADYFANPSLKLTHPTMPTATAVPANSFLSIYAERGAFTDCYTLTVPFAASLPEFIEAFYTTRLFKLERWLLWKLLSIPSSDAQARDLAVGVASTFSAWKVENRSDSEILLDAGQTRSWLSVAQASSLVGGTILHFGSAVVPMRPNGKFGAAFHVLLIFHQLYSKLLLSAAARNLRTRHVQSRG